MTVQRLVFLIVMVALPGYSGNVERWTTNYYSVTGATLVEIRQSLQQSRAWKDKSNTDGLTEWRINWRYNVLATSNDCRIQSFSTETLINITMPRWVAPTNAPQNVREAWTGYIKALGEHEAGHGQIGQAAAAELHKRVNALPGDASCESLKSRIEATCRQLIQDYKKRDKEYDKRTDHGATQGARLPGRGWRRQSTKP